MQNKNSKLLITVVLFSLLSSLSCTKKIDDAYLNPNAATVQPIESILSGVIGSFTAFFSSAGTGYGVQADGILLGRYIQYWGTQTNGENYGQMGGTIGADATGGLWAAVYYGQGQNLNRIVQWGTEQQKWDYVGVALAIRAWGWLELTNIYGDAILKEAFNTNLAQFHYDTQPEFYDSCRAICFRSLNYLNRTDGNVSATNLAIGDAYFFNGDVNSPPTRWSTPTARGSFSRSSSCSPRASTWTATRPPRVAAGRPHRRCASSACERDLEPLPRGVQCPLS